MYINEIYWEIQKYKDEKAKIIKNFRDENDVRCQNCKTKMRAMKDNDYKTKKLCKTCWGSTDYGKELRKDLYILENGKYKKNKNKISYNNNRYAFDI